jgi:hypothetical protein
MDALVGLSSDEDASSDEDSKGEAAPAQKKAKKNDIDLQKLQEHGYSGGLSVLHVPDKPADGPSWDWCVSV